MTLFGAIMAVWGMAVITALTVVAVVLVIETWRDR